MLDLFQAELADFRDDWALSDKALSTVDGYIDWLTKWHSWACARGEQTLTLRSAKAYLAVLKAHSHWNAYMACRAMKAFAKWWAADHKQDDPLADLQFIRQPKERPQRTASAADIDKLLDTCGGDFRGMRDRALILVMFSAGMRRSEVARMMWHEIDLATGHVVVPLTKNGQHRTVRLHKTAQQALRRYWRALEEWEMTNMRIAAPYVWVSTSRKSQLTPNGLGQMVVDRSREASIDVTAHSLRRGFAVEGLRKGGSETYLRKMAGWNSPRMVDRYVSQVAAEQAIDEHERIFG